MPYLETPEELAEKIADWAGVYGGHDDKCTGDVEKAPCCRPCYETLVADRIRKAVENEKSLS